MSGVIGFEGDTRNNKAIQGIEQLNFKEKRIIRQTWFSLGKDLKNEANQEILRKPKTGRTYFIRTKGGRRRRHVASAPGESHANLSGKLRRAISWKVYGAERMEFGYGISTTASNQAPEYDSFVEDGTSKMEPRPSIENAVKVLKNRVQNHFEREMLREFKRT